RTRKTGPGIVSATAGICMGISFEESRASPARSDACCDQWLALVEGRRNLRMNFYLVGAPKAGTTSLYRYLDQHPQIYMSPIKEPHYFADEIRAGNFDGDMRRAIVLRQPAFEAWLAGSRTEKFSS